MNKTTQSTTISTEQWLIKSLHPSLVVDKPVTIPDGCPYHLVPIEYRTTSTISYVTQADTWQCQLAVMPHPVLFYSWTAADMTGANPTNGHVNNNNIYSGDDADVSRSFASLCEASRCSYASMTVELVCTDLTNQGVVKVVQFPVKHTTMVSASDPLKCYRKVWCFDVNDELSYDEMDAYKTCVVQQAKIGAYVPIKLDAKARKWRPTQDTIGLGTSSTLTPTDSDVLVTSIGGSPFPPFHCDYPAASNVGVGYQKPYTDQTALIWFSGISKSASLRVTYRLGLELLPRPGENLSLLTSYGAVRNNRDLDEHDYVWRMLPDAYPADYNDLNKFLKILKSAIGVAHSIVTPLLPAPLTPAIDFGVLKVNSLIDRKLAAKEKEKQKLPSRVQRKSK